MAQALRWTRGVLLPARLVLAARELERALGDLQQSDDPHSTAEALGRARRSFDRLERLAPDSVLGLRALDLARHLRFAERSVERGEPMDEFDLGRMPREDLAALVRLIERREALPADAEGLRSALSSLESPSIEFKTVLPEARKMAREFAALAPAGGWVYLGVDDDGTIVGLDLVEVAAVDKMDLQVRGMTKSVDPPPALATTWLAEGGLVVCAVHVLTSGEPIHYVDSIPYVRDGTASRPARADEVKQCVLQMASGRRPRLHIEELQLLDDGRDARSYEGLAVKATFSNIGGGPALSVRAYMDHPQLPTRSTREHVGKLDADAGTKQLILGVVEPSPGVAGGESTEPTFIGRLEYRDADGQWWATSASFWVGSVVPGFQPIAAHLDDQSERVIALPGPRRAEDIWHGPWTGADPVDTSG